MLNFLSDDIRRNPFDIYEQIRSLSPLLHDPATDLWMLFDYDSVYRVLTDHETFSSKHGPDWIVFTDPPRHTKLRALVSKAFTPRSIDNLEPRIRRLCADLLDQVGEREEIDLAADLSVQLPTMVIAEMLGIPLEDRPRCTRWNDVILNMSYTIGRHDEEATRAHSEFLATTAEMDTYLGALLDQRRLAPKDDLLTRLAQAEVDGDRLTHSEILGFFQGLLLAGSETTTNLINNAMVLLLDNPDQLALLRQRTDLLPSAIEEALRYRSPLQWMYRKTRRDTVVHGQVVPAGKLILAMIGSANHDPKQFREPRRFDITRDPNPHIAFGHGIHFCIGAPLARIETKIALGDLLRRFDHLEYAESEPWQPRRALHIHGPNRLPIRVKSASSSTVAV
ncbi:MAG TPA: cytochrome P450 [Terriglobia bacterium]|nr:cytochrome P450 [Terriglobia bacterium]